MVDDGIRHILGRHIKAGFPATLGYSIWALTMILPALVALNLIRWKLEHSRRDLLFGALIGFTGAGGQLILFKALRTGPAYLVFPFISLSPVITIIISLSLYQVIPHPVILGGMFLALVAILLMAIEENEPAG